MFKAAFILGGSIALSLFITGCSQQEGSITTPQFQLTSISPLSARASNSAPPTPEVIKASMHDTTTASPATTPPTAATTPATDPTPTPAASNFVPPNPLPPLSGANTTADQKAAVWSDEDGTQPWTETVLALIDQNFESFDKAQDTETFCPGYSAATKRQKEVCWLRIIGAVVKFESTFNPGDSFKEPDGNYSVGLYSLSPDECNDAPSVDALKNPIANLMCGTVKMANIIAKDQYIDGPDHTGAASYWSTLRLPYVYAGYNVGKKLDVIGITKNYLDYQ